MSYDFRTPAQQRLAAISYLTVAAIAGLAVALTLGTLTLAEFTALLLVLAAAAVYFARRQFRPAARHYTFENWAVFYDKVCFAAREWNYSSPVHTDSRCWNFPNLTPDSSRPTDTLTLELTGPHGAQITGPAATMLEVDRRLPGGTAVADLPPADQTSNRGRRNVNAREQTA